MTKSVMTLAATMVCSTSLQAAGAVVYEPWTGDNGANSNAGGYAGGTGLDGAWSGNQGGNSWIWVQDATMDTGNLPSSGREYVSRSFGGGFEMVNTTSALSSNGLLTDGSTLWFSYVTERASASFASGGWGGFILGNEAADSSSSGTKMISGAGEGIGVQMERNTSYFPAAWVGAGQGATPKGATSIGNAGAGVTQLIVGKIEWGAAAANETLTLYSPGLNDLGNLGTGHTVSFADMNQAAFNTITIATREPGDNVMYDEIRFGATYDDVLGIPEPSTTALLGLGGLALILRRRK